MLRYSSITQELAGLLHVFLLHSIFQSVIFNSLHFPLYLSPLSLFFPRSGPLRSHFSPFPLIISSIFLKPKLVFLPFCLSFLRLLPTFPSPEVESLPICRHLSHQSFQVQLLGPKYESKRGDGRRGRKEIQLRD